MSTPKTETKNRKTEPVRLITLEERLNQPQTSLEEALEQFRATMPLSEQGEKLLQKLKSGS